METTIEFLESAVGAWALMIAGYAVYMLSRFAMTRWSIAELDSAQRW